MIANGKWFSPIALTNKVKSTSQAPRGKQMHQWMKMAYDEALSGMAANEGGPFGAAIVQNGKLIALAHNEA